LQYTARRFQLRVLARNGGPLTADVEAAAAADARLPTLSDYAGALGPDGQYPTVSMQFTLRPRAAELADVQQPPGVGDTGAAPAQER
jgi:hypothetical protein